MKTNSVFLISLLALSWLFWSCETAVDEDWSGFGSSAHFPAPHENDHVGYIQDNPEALADCRNCHGADYDGGSSSISCLDCHETNGVISLCNNCHGNSAGDPDNPLNWAPQDEDDAHTAHLLGGDYSRAVECDVCHTIPVSWASNGHIDTAPAEIVFSGLAQWHDANPVWDAGEESCSDTYCHGPDEPKWDDDDVSCGSCHELPPPPLHPQNDQCVLCHDSVINAAGEIINPNLHLNGAVNF
jgi:predicted CxxxxCH...CXXCH cytochrome family protein